MRAREAGIAVGELEPGPLDAITDVAGVRVGHSTLVEGEEVRTGVTVVLFDRLPLFAAPDRLNGNGDMTGLEFVREFGLLASPVAITNTHSVGVVRDALVAVAVEQEGRAFPWDLPIVAETWDGLLNDVNGFHVRPEHVREAIAAAAGGPVAEGNVGGGTGMICHGFKGGIGTASRRAHDWTVGVLVQANHGKRRRLLVNGAPVGAELGDDLVALPRPSAVEGAGSIIVLAITDAPLLPHQCKRLARRAALGIGRTGGAGESSSGDLILAVATGNHPDPSGESAVRMPPEEALSGLFYAAIEATEAAIVSALLAAETMTARGTTAHALTADMLLDVLRRYNRA